MRYDYLVVGSGLYGATFAHMANKAGKNVLVIDKRPHIAGNAYTEQECGINVHRYGAHIFHTDSDVVWEFVNRFAEFNRYTHSPMARYRGEVYSLPFNMHTFSKMWGVTTPQAAEKVIERQRKEIKGTPQNLEEQAISLVGRDVYEKLICGYTEKQWGRPCTELPPSIIKRIPVRLTYDNAYFGDKHQGIPIGGYTKMVAKMLEGVEVQLNTDFFEYRMYLSSIADHVVYTGPIDKYFDYRFGHLDYRTVSFHTMTYNVNNYQGAAVVNYTDRDVPIMRVIEHKWFENVDTPDTVVSYEFSSEWRDGSEPYYPVNDERNNSLYDEYRKLAEKETRVTFGGRLGEYRYYDMDDVIMSAMNTADMLL